MKRCIAWILAAVLLIGCGGMAFSVRAEAAEAQSRRAARLGGGGETTTETVETEPAAQDGLQRGVISGDVYENPSLGFGFQLQEGWSFYSDEELAEMTGTAYESVTDETLSEILAEADIVWDMYASSSDSMYMTGVEIENIGALYGQILDESTYLDLSMESLDGDGLEALGLSDGTMERSTIEFAGAEHPCVKIQGTVQGLVSIYQTQVCIKVGDYMVVVLLQSLLEDQTESIADYYYPVSDDSRAAEPAEEDIAIHFIPAMGSDGTYAYVDLIGISDPINVSDGKTFYAAEDVDYYYIVAVTDDQLADMTEINDYWYRDEDSDDPPVYHLTGYMGTIGSDTREAFKTAFNIDDEDFDYYFGEDYLDATR